MQVVILAGGLGTRMAAYTSERPKALIDVLGKPFLAYQIAWLARAGVDRITFSIGYRGEQIREYLMAHPEPRVRIDWVEEKELLGTAGALRLVMDRGLLDDQFMLLYGDSYLPVDLPAVWSAFRVSQAAALMTVFKNEGQFDRSNATYHEGRVPFYSKVRVSDPPATYIDYGLSGLTRALIADRVRPGEKMDLAVIFEDLSARGGLAGLEVFERFYEIGSPLGLQEFVSYAKSHLT